MKSVIFHRRGRWLLGAAIFLSPAFTDLAAHAQTAAATTHHRKPVKHSKTTSHPANGPQLGAQTAPAATMVPTRSQNALRNVAPANTVSFAQGGKSEELIVVGSALTTANNTSANPVQIVTSKQIQQTGVTNLNDYLSRLPSIGASGTSNSNTNGGNGASCVDLRNLGQNRVLVLVDGKRTTPNGNSNCIDLNTIPVQMVQSIEILKDGGSELYGADAVSGVLNIKLRHDLNTGSVTIRGGITGHGDNRTGMISAMKGWNFDHDKGNLTLGGSYMTQGGVTQRDRSWSSVPLGAVGAYPTNPNLQVGSIITPGGTYFGSENTYVGNLDTARPQSLFGNSAGV